MRTAMSELALVRPTSLHEALAHLRSESPPMPIAGCTDVFVALNFGTLAARYFMDLTLLPLRDITLERDRRDGGGETLRIGALATYSALLASPLVRERLPMLVDAARQIGGVQIQNRGTIGGNIANGSPAGDTLPVLAVSDATVVLASASGERRVPFNSFYTGYRISVRRSDELIVALEIPPIEGMQWFRKVGTRAAQAISKLVVAGVRAQQPRLAFGSVAATVVRASRTEAALAAGESVERAGEILAAELTPITDVRSTAEYRRRVAVNLLHRFWRDTAHTAPV